MTVPAPHVTTSRMAQLAAELLDHLSRDSDELIGGAHLSPYAIDVFLRTDSPEVGVGRLVSLVDYLAYRLDTAGPEPVPAKWYPYGSANNARHIGDYRAEGFRSGVRVYIVAPLTSAQAAQAGFVTQSSSDRLAPYVAAS